MRAVAFLSVLILSYSLLPSRASAQDAGMNFSQYCEYIRTLSDDTTTRADLRSVWENEIKLGISSIVNREWEKGLNLTFTGIGIGNECGDNVELLADMKYCSIVPEYNSRYNSILFNRYELIPLITYVDQAVVLYLVGIPEIDSPEKLDSYILNTLRPAFLERAAQCSSDSPEPLTLARIANLSFFARAEYRGRPYEEIMRDAQQQSSAMDAADMAVLFSKTIVLVHEAAHHLQRNGDWPDADRESDADRLVGDVFRQSKASVTIGIPFLQLMSEVQRESKLQCRIQRLAEADMYTENLGWPSNMTRRLANLRNYYRSLECSE